MPHKVDNCRQLLVTRISPRIAQNQKPILITLRKSSKDEEGHNENLPVFAWTNNKINRNEPILGSSRLIGKGLSLSLFEQKQTVIVVTSLLPATESAVNSDCMTRA